MRNYFFLTLISIALFVVAFTFYVKIQDVLLGTSNIVYGAMKTQIFDSLTFGILWAVLPFIMNMVWKKMEVKKKTTKIVSIGLILLTVLLFTITKSLLLSTGIQTVESINLPGYFIAGTITGLLISHSLKSHYFKFRLK